MIGVALDSPSDSQVPTHGANYVPSMPAFSGNPILLERTRHDAIMMPPCLRYLSTSTECEGGTGPVSTNPGSMQAREYGLTHERYIVARRLEVAIVAGLNNYVDFGGCLGAAGFRVFCGCILRRYTACCKFEVALPHFPIYD